MTKECHSTPSLNVSGNLLAERALAYAGLTDQQDQTPLTTYGRLECSDKLPKLCLPANERRPPQTVIEPTLARPLWIS
jgi:hypothetical protein